MSTKTRRFLTACFLIINVALLILLLISAYSHLFSPDKWWFFAILGLLFPIFLLAGILATLVLIIKKHRLWMFMLLACLLSVPTVLKYVSFGSNPTFEAKKEENHLRILTWNVGLMSFSAKDTVQAIEQNIQILNEIKASDADVLCLQEFLTSEIPDGHYNFMDSIKRTMNYPYRYFCIDRSNINEFFTSGSLIMSRYPLMEAQRDAFEEPFLGSVAAVNVMWKKKTFRLLTTRLQSLNFNQNEYAIFDNLRKANVKLEGSKSMLKKIKYGYQQRKHQIEMVQRQIEQTPFPVIFTGDLNDVPNSYAYSKIKGKMQDAWLKKGKGLGRTFSKISPHLRIDYLFADEEFKIEQVKRIITTGSDHYGLLVDLSLK